MADEAAPVSSEPANTTTPPIPVAEFPAATVDRLQAIMQKLLTLRNTLGASTVQDMLTQQYSTIDAILIDLLQSMREIQTGPSLMDQFAARLGLELEQYRGNAELALAKQRDNATAQAQQTTASLLSAFLPQRPVPAGAQSVTAGAA